jgi:hypothetical protein
MKQYWCRCLWLFLLWMPGTAQAQQTEEPSPTPESEQPEGLEVQDLGTARGYVRKPLALRYRRSMALTWVGRGFLFLSEGAIAYARYDQGTGFAEGIFLAPMAATGIALYSVYQMRRGLREHGYTHGRANLRTAGIITLVLGDLVAVLLYWNWSPGAGYLQLALSQLVGVMLIQSQAWGYRRQIRDDVAPYGKWSERETQETRRWVPIVVPIPGGALGGVGVTF